MHCTAISLVPDIDDKLFIPYLVLIGSKYHVLLSTVGTFGRDIGVKSFYLIRFDYMI